MDSFRIKIGESFTLKLKGGGGIGGYQWKYTIEDSRCITVKELPPKEKDLLGGAAQQTFTITGMQAGTSKLQFHLQRSWEKNTSPIETTTYTITVE